MGGEGTRQRRQRDRLRPRPLGFEEDRLVLLSLFPRRNLYLGALSQRLIIIRQRRRGARFVHRIRRKEQRSRRQESVKMRVRLISSGSREIEGRGARGGVRDCQKS